MNATVESRLKELRFFVGSLKRFFIKWLSFQIPTCKVLKEVLICSTQLAHINIVFNTRNLRTFVNSLRILENILSRAVERWTGLQGWEQKGRCGAESFGNISSPRPFPLGHFLRFTGKTLLLDANALLRLSLECQWARGPRNVPQGILKTKENT